MPPSNQGVDRPSLHLPGLRRAGSASPHEDTLLSIPLPARANPWRIWLIDDDPDLLEKLSNAARDHYSNSMHLAVLDTQALGDRDVGQELAQRFTEHGAPDLAVIDFNLSWGGFKGVELLKVIRDLPGGIGCPVVMATGAPLHLLESGGLPDENFVGLQPSSWHAEALNATAEALIYAKLGKPAFLGRLGEGMANWQVLARRRAWANLQARVIDQLGAGSSPNEIGQYMAEFLHRELHMQTAVIRWRADDHRFIRLGGAGAMKGVPSVKMMDPNDIPILSQVASPQSTRTCTVRNTGLTPEECGRHLDGLVGRRYLGCGAALGHEVFGFFSLLRDPGMPAFDKADEDGLVALAGVLATALGRQAALDEERGRQAALLAFAKSAAQSTSRSRVPICTALIELLHRVLHGNQDTGRVTCRLVDFSSGLLERKGQAQGYGRDNHPLPLSISTEAKQSVYAYTVLNRTPASQTDSDKHYTLIDDIIVDPLAASIFYDTTGLATRTSLCVPLLVGQHAIGAVNLEHKTPRRYAGQDVEFVQAVVAIAAQAITNSTASRVQRTLLELFAESRELLIENLKTRLGAALFSLTGFSAMVELKAADPDNIAMPWRATQITARMKDVDPNQLLSTVNAAYATHWWTSINATGTGVTLWVAKLLLEKAWTTRASGYTDQAEHFLSLAIAPGLKQRADAILWLQKDREAAPYGALLLLWALPPPMDADKLELLDEVARLYAALQAQSDQVQTLVDRAVIGESQGKIGAIMQHFRHRLASSVRALEGGLVDLERHIHDPELNPLIPGDLAFLRNVHQGMVVGYEASRKFVKRIEMQPVLLANLVNETLAHDNWQERLRKRHIDVHVNVPAGLTVQTDPDIAELALFTLLENAHDAILASKPARQRIDIKARHNDDRRRVVLEVTDSGPGVPQDFQGRLFVYGETTKDQGLGSALAFAKSRLGEAKGSLSFVGNMPGARFKMDWPVSGP